MTEYRMNMPLTIGSHRVSHREGTFAAPTSRPATIARTTNCPKTIGSMLHAKTARTAAVEAWPPIRRPSQAATTALMWRLAMPTTPPTRLHAKHTRQSCKTPPTPDATNAPVEAATPPSTANSRTRWQGRSATRRSIVFPGLSHTERSGGVRRTIAFENASGITRASRFGPAAHFPHAYQRLH